MAKKQFKAESKRLMELMINSIYTHKEIFLREIISNASDAIDKLCYLALTDDNVGMDRSDFRIRVTVDKDARTITVSDNGIGMNKAEMDSNLGVIARSGSFQFKKDMPETQGEDIPDIDIIGQFGVGFYSAFMVADKVTVLSHRYGEDTGAKWESSGVDGYTVEDFEKDTPGTDVIMHIKEDTEDEHYSEYLDSWRLQDLVKKYSDYVRWPIKMDVERYEQQETGETDEDGKPKTKYVTVTSEETVNSMIPIWQRSKSDVTDEECIQFYKDHFHDQEDPLAVIRVDAEGTVSFKAMLFIPGKAPYDLYTRDYQPGLQLYSSGVMIMERCPDLLPDYFRFVRGVVDSPDLSLNISREMLQHDRQLKVIANNLEKRIKTKLSSMLTDDRDAYTKFWEQFGALIKYGIVSDYGMHKDSLQDLLVYRCSGKDGLVSLEEYVKDMPEGQSKIYYAAAESAARAESLPQAEQVKDAGYSLIYMTDEADTFVVSVLGKFQDKEFCNISSDDLGLESEEEKADTEKKTEENKDLLDFVKETLAGQVEDVRLSHKLRSYPVCITTDGDITLEAERYLKSLPGNQFQDIKAKKVLEINGSHDAFSALQKAFSEDKEKAAKLAKILLAQAKLIADLPIDDPREYTDLVCSLF
ncbi:MAG: molecular chaperone HtpG [Oscillospiraceae bacterium]|nr:molecular chaperone HtpG [Oscillospiraceae bacterium]